jgi:hypothetical protein
MRPTLSLLVYFGVIGAIIWFAVALRRRKRVAALTLVGTVSFFGGTIIAAVGARHLVAITDRAMRGTLGTPAFSAPPILQTGDPFVYDFRFYALVQLGVLLVVGGSACVILAPRLTRGEPRAWKATLWASVALLAMNMPLVPIEDNAYGPAALAFLTLAALTVTRKRFGLSGRGPPTFR